MIKWCLNLAEEYLGESDWKTLAAIKFCLFSMGMMAGIMLPVSYGTYAMPICGAVFVLTYVPLMAKLIRIARRK